MSRVCCVDMGQYLMAIIIESNQDIFIQLVVQIFIVFLGKAHLLKYIYNNMINK